MTVAEVCELLSVSKQTLYRLLRAGELRPSRVGKRLRFHPAEIAAFLERNREPVGRKTNGAPPGTPPPPTTTRSTLAGSAETKRDAAHPDRARDRGAAARPCGDRRRQRTGQAARLDLGESGAVRSPPLRGPVAG
ncbi:MAG: helix-turn-helix domain-containing protein [Gaiellaceae bacterium]